MAQTHQSGINAWVWQVIRVYTPLLLRLGSSFFLTGWLSPFLTGQFSLVWMLLSFFAIPADGGVKRIALGSVPFSEADAQQWTRLNRKQAAFWAVGTFFSGCLIAFIMDSWFALAIAIFSSMYVFLYGLTASAFAIEHRDGQFKKLARRDLTASVVSVASAWVFALNGFVEAALMSLFSLPPVLICLLMMLEKPAALKTDAKDGILDKKSPAWASIGADALHALHMRLDGLAIGFLAGQTTLGLYNRANGIVHQPVAFLQSVNNPVVERSLLAQPESLHKELHRIAAGFFFFLATAWVVANTAPRWIPVVWSEAWLTSGAFMLPLVLAGGAQWLQIAAEPLLINQGLHQKRFRIRLFSLGAIVIFTVLLPLVGVLKALWILGCLQLCIGFGTAVVTFGWSQTRILMVSSGLVIVFSILFETTLTEETIIFQLQSGCALMFALYHLQSLFQLSKP